MDDTKRALLGDRDAQKHLSNRQILIPCASCRGGKFKIQYVFGDWWVECAECGSMCGLRSSREEAIKAWNTRAPILSAEELERLEDTDEKF